MKALASDGGGCARRAAVAFKTPRVVTALIAVALALNGSTPLAAQLPLGNARMQRAIDTGLAFLEKSKDGRVGAKALVGLCFLKSGRPNMLEHPKVREAIEAVRKAVRGDVEKIRLDIYSAGISLMFLAELGQSRYQLEIEKLVQYLHAKQKDAGAWGYPPEHTHGATCDTSMTQYAILGLWEAEELAGVATPLEKWEKAARWLLLTQDPSGGFGYQGKPAYQVGERVKQGGVRHSLTAAGLASLYVVKDRLGFRELKRKEDAELPAAFEPLAEPQQAKKKQTDLTRRDFGRAVSSANRWIEQNYNVNKLDSWTYYSLYALERFEAFREADLAGSPVPPPKTERSKWSIRAIRYVLKTQKPDGSWESNSGAVPSTCFALLVLTGSTRQSLAKSRVVRYQRDVMRGGRGFPHASGGLRLRAGRVVVRPLRAGPEEVLRRAGNPADRQHAAAVEALADWTARARPEELQSHLPALRRLARRGPAGVRVLAILGLGRADDFEFVPSLIEILEKGSPEEGFAAAKALGQISRTFDTRGVGPHTGRAGRQAAVQAWRSWYARHVQTAGQP